ncbi:senescence associated gene 20 [Actinidia rufa]|uniref:Senescence associated gene 20 n=1 Tax=Actinidia rufa TaxID=165716 RepID=A0A7J0GWB4_9ERIC|nr:senescence associated gene 20 [Actinidia rufa]
MFIHRTLTFSIEHKFVFGRSKSSNWLTHRKVWRSPGNQEVVLALYEALSARDVDTVHKLLASDLEWWFHGPPPHQFMMRLLTGTATSPSDSFDFVPQSIAAFGSTVLVEGCDHTRSIAWVHAWTVTDGIITQVREYFNTSLTVTRLGNTGKSSQSDLSPASITSLYCPSVWESSLSNQVGKSVPGLVLAI